MKVKLFLLILGLGMAAAPAAAQGKTPFPPFTGARLYVAGVPNVYDPLRAEIQRLERSSAQTYYVVVIQSSGPGEWATRDYLDALYQTWIGQAARKGLTLDPDRAVVVALAVHNRQLSVHGGTVLQNQYGLRGQTIDQEIVQPHFIPHARAGNYVQGLKVLLHEIEKWLTARDAALRQQRQEAAARAAQVRRDAEASLAGAARLHAEAQRELKAKKEAGLAVQSLAAQVQQAAQALAAARKTLAGHPQTALQQGQQVQQTFQQVLTQLRQLAALQVEADAQLDRDQALAAEVEAAFQEKDRAGLAVGWVQRQLEEVRREMGTARQSVQTDPSQALTQGRQSEQRLQAALAHLEQLPGLRRQVQEKAAVVGALEKAVRADLDRARQAGADVSAGESTLRSIREQLATAGRQQNVDYPQALQTFAAAENRLWALQQQFQSLYRRRRLVTRTLPAALFLLALTVVLVILAVKRLRHTRTRRAVGAQLQTFKDQVVHLMERLEALKERHQLLPVSDEDFSEPMAGDTLALYNQLQEDLGGLWDQWIQKSKVGERAQTLVVSEKPFRVRQYEEAQRLLTEAGSFEEIEAAYQTYVENLDRLGQAHEQAEAVQQSVEERRERLRQQWEALQAAELATTPYQADLETCATLIERGRSALRADPLGARAALEEALEKVAALGRWTEQILHHFHGAQEVLQRLEEATHRAAERRAQGFLLTEQEGNPDPLLAHGRSQHSATLLALHRGEAETAAQHLEQAFAFAGRAREVIEQQVAAKAYCEEQIPARRTETQRLREVASAAQAHRDELDRDFAADSWRAVADNLTQAQDFLDTFDPLVDQAASESAESVQHYFRAAGILEQVQQKQEETHALLQGIGLRRQELMALREECRTRRDELTDQAQQVHHFIGEHDQIIREEAREDLAAAEETRRQAVAQTEAARPHWPALQQQLNQVREGLVTALREAEEDVRSHQQLTAQRDAVRREVDRLSDFLRGHSEDRPRANQRFQAARETLERVTQESATPRADWARLLRQLEEAAADLEQAEQLAQEDLRLAHQAAAEIAEAERELQRAKGYFRLGIAADVSAAESYLSQARMEWGAQAYEQAIERANAAERAAREAYDDAERQAHQKQQQLDRERRLREAASQPSSGFGLSSFSRSSSSSWSSSSSRSSWSSGSGSSSSSWSSGSSQSSW